VITFVLSRILDVGVKVLVNMILSKVTNALRVPLGAEISPRVNPLTASLNVNVTIALFPVLTVYVDRMIVADGIAIDKLLSIY